MPEAYLTIDDTPSPFTNELLDFLKERDIQAMFFLRGAFLDQNPDPVIRAAQEGHILANHSYTHTPAGVLGVKGMIKEIHYTESLIDDIYLRAGIEKPGKYFRFPYLDRGNGVKSEQDYDSLINDKAALNELFYAPRIMELQAWLKENGYTQPYNHITHPFYQIPEVRDAADCLLTYTSFDWMLTARHKGKQTYKTVSDLKEKIDRDPYLHVENSSHIILFHDDRECILPEVCSLIDYMCEKNMKFRRYQ